MFGNLSFLYNLEIRNLLGIFWQTVEKTVFLNVFSVI